MGVTIVSGSWSAGCHDSVGQLVGRQVPTAGRRYVGMGNQVCDVVLSLVGPALDVVKLYARTHLSTRNEGNAHSRREVGAPPPSLSPHPPGRISIQNLKMRNIFSGGSARELQLLAKPWGRNSQESVP